MTFHRASALVLAALLTLLLVPTAASADVAVSVQADRIDPDPVVVAVGEAIRFTNDSGDVVRLVDDQQRWDSGDLGPGETFVFTFNIDGVFTFTSEDGAISGTIEVGDAGADPAATDADPAATDADPTPTEDAPTEEAADPPAAPDALAATGLPSARIAWLAALTTLVGIVLVRRTETR